MAKKKKLSVSKDKIVSQDYDTIGGHCPDRRLFINSRVALAQETGQPFSNSTQRLLNAEDNNGVADPLVSSDEKEYFRPSNPIAISFEEDSYRPE